MSKNIFYLLLLPLLAFHCQESPQPTKEQLISDLRTVYELISKGESRAAVEYYKGSDDLSPEGMADHLDDLIDRREISAEGIDILEEHGNFGKLMDVFPDRGELWMEHNGITNPEDCYGLGLARAEVGAYWDGKRFLLIRLDDVGKLREPESR